jgi:hypothetical protein
MKRKISILLIILFFYGNVTSVFSQSGCYERLRQSGLKLLQQNKCEEAVKDFDMAKICDDYDGNSSDIDDLIKKANHCIEARGKTQTQLDLPNGTDYTFPSTAGSDTVFVNSNVSFNIDQFAICATWLTARVIEKGIVVTWQENAGASTRQCSFKIKAKDKEKTVTVTQQEAKLYLNIADSVIPVSPERGTKTVDVETNSDSLNLSSHGNEWCKIRQNRYRLYIDCERMEQKGERTFSFDVIAKSKAGDKLRTVTVIQSGVSLNVSPARWNFTKEGGSKTITVTTNYANKDWKVADTANLAQQGFYIEKKYVDSLVIVAEKNSSVTQRKSTVTVKAGEVIETINLLQESAPVTLSLTENSVKNCILQLDGAGNPKTKDGNIIKINTNIPLSDIEYPHWCKIDTASHPRHIAISVNSSTGFKDSRTDTVTIKASDTVTAKIIVCQDKRYHQLRVTRNRQSPFGISAGYTSKNWKHSDDASVWGIFEEGSSVKGIQVGLRYDPYFAPDIFGLGLHTGIYYTYYQAKSAHIQNNSHYEFNEHTISLHVHLNYKMEFDKTFGIFVHGGLNLDYGCSGQITQVSGNSGNNYNENIYDKLGRLNTSAGYGVGFCLGRLLFEYNGYLGITNHSKNADYKIFQNSYTTFTLTFMFNKKNNSK